MIFVFGSNLDGNHAGGAAFYARLHCGAVDGLGEGLAGESYALPTVGIRFAPMTFGLVFESVRRFIDFARSHKDLEFKVTRVGCGIAGFKDSEIAPIFCDAPRNCLFDEAWEEYLPKDAKFWGTI